MLCQADAVGLNFMPIFVNLAQIGCSVQIPAGLVGIDDVAGAKVHLFIAALAASRANAFPVILLHKSCSQIGHPSDPSKLT
jgi:hypothetical protein